MVVSSRVWRRAVCQKCTDRHSRGSFCLHHRDTSVHDVMSRKTAIHRVTAMRTYKIRGLCLDMSIQLQAVIIGRGWNERKMRADRKEGMKTRKNGQQQVEFQGRALWESERMRNRLRLTQGLAYCRTSLCEPLRSECARVTEFTIRLEHN